MTMNWTNRLNKQKPKDEAFEELSRMYSLAERVLLQNTPYSYDELANSRAFNSAHKLVYKLQANGKLNEKNVIAVVFEFAKTL